MRFPIEIQEPNICVLKTLPSSLGTIDYFMVIYDKVDFPNSDWIDENESEISETIDDDNFEHPIFILHSTSSVRAEPIIPLKKLEPGETVFVRNITQFDSALTAHCLSVRAEQSSLLIKSGFHHWPASDHKGYDGQISWETMDEIYDGIYRFLDVSSAKFWPMYSQALDHLSNLVK